MLGKKVEELQKDIVINENNKISGTLNHITDYEEFSSNKEEQTGNYLALYFPEAKEGSTITCEIKGEGAVVKKPIEVDKSDGNIVLKIANKEQTIEVVCEEKETRTLDLSELELKNE